MSSEYSSSFAASKCIDGVPADRYESFDDQSSLCHSNQGDDQWLSIELAEEASVDFVEIYNREACCADRLGDYEIWLASAPGIPDGSTAQRCAEAQAPGVAAEVLIHGCGGLNGTYVTIFLPGEDRQLNLNEVYVYGHPMPSPPPTPPMAPPVPPVSPRPNELPACEACQAGGQGYCFALKACETISLTPWCACPPHLPLAPQRGPPRAAM